MQQITSVALRMLLIQSNSLSYINIRGKVQMDLAAGLYLQSYSHDPTDLLSLHRKITLLPGPKPTFKIQCFHGLRQLLRRSLKQTLCTFQQRRRAKRGGTVCGNVGLEFWFSLGKHFIILGRK